MSYSPAFFGPPLWKIIHAFAASATTQDKRNEYKKFIETLTLLIPCDTCRIHYIENLKEHSIEPFMASNIQLFYWSWKLHDTVNKQTNKPAEQCWSYDQAKLHYFGKPKSMENNKGAFETQSRSVKVQSSNKTSVTQQKRECTDSCDVPNIVNVKKLSEKQTPEIKIIKKKTFSVKNAGR